uniref:BED-type domain-containing protein n=1 Tax=Loa loa TaxID=7209 RepID=A0A1I7VRC6_LOALO
MEGDGTVVAAAAASSYFAIRKSTKVEDSTDDTMKRARTEMSTSSVISGTSTKSTGYNSIVIPAPIVPSQYNAKNAGRKKTNPVWNYFVDLKTKGLSGVRCRYCEWITNDRSPTTLKFHLKRKHDTGLGGVWNIVEERIGINQPQGRSRFVINNKNGETVPFMIPVDTEIRPEPDRDQQCYPEAGARVVVDAKPSSSQQALLDQFIQNATKNAKLNGTLSGITASTSTYTRLALPQLQPSSNIACGQDNIFDAGDDAGESNEPSYVLSDGSNLSELLRVANDMDLAFTYNSRRTGEFCFESNAQDMRGRLVVFADLGTKVAVRERFNGSDLSYEEWSKADWKQFLWAVRGKCMNVLRGL